MSAVREDSITMIRHYIKLVFQRVSTGGGVALTSDALALLIDGMVRGGGHLHRAAQLLILIGRRLDELDG